MKLFSKANPSNTMFQSSSIGLGSSRPHYLKPTRKEIKQITRGARLSSQPHGIKPRMRGTMLRRHYREAAGITRDFSRLRPITVDELSRGITYNSNFNLLKNLNIRL